MGRYSDYQTKLEKQFNKDIKEIITEYYITKDLGPSVTARELGVPRNIILYFIREHDLKQAKHENIKKKVLV